MVLDRKNSIKIRTELLRPSFILPICFGKLRFEVNIFLEFYRDKKERDQQKNEKKKRKLLENWKIWKLCDFLFD